MPAQPCGNEITSALVLCRRVTTVYGYVFFCYSFGYLLSRACLLCCSAACVHEASQKPKAVLFAVPSDGYNTEVITKKSGLYKELQVSH
jgi:hypothetical protein